MHALAFSKNFYYDTLPLLAIHKVVGLRSTNVCVTKE